MKRVVALGFAIFIAWLVFGVLPLLIIGDSARAGEFGDQFGAVNALFSGIAIAGIIVTILLQRQDIELQREDLRISKDEYARSIQAQREAGESMAAQARFMAASAQLSALRALIDIEEGQLKQLHPASAERQRCSRRLEELYKRSRDFAGTLAVISESCERNDGDA